MTTMAVNERRREALLSRMTMLSRALLTVIEENPGIDEPRLARLASERDGGGRHGDVSHCAKNLRATLRDRYGLVEQTHESFDRWWLSPKGHYEMGHDGLPPTSDQLGLL